MAKIEDFKARMMGSDVGRSIQFRISLSFPTSDKKENIEFLCNSEYLPKLKIENTSIKYRGLTAKFAGYDSCYPWTINIDDSAIQVEFERWKNAIDNSLISEYYIDFEAIQIDRNGKNIRKYKFFSAYPTKVLDACITFSLVSYSVEVISNFINKS